MGSPSVPSDDKRAHNLPGVHREDEPAKVPGERSLNTLTAIRTVGVLGAGAPEREDGIDIGGSGATSGEGRHQQTLFTGNQRRSAIAFRDVDGRLLSASCSQPAGRSPSRSEKKKLATAMLAKL